MSEPVMTATEALVWLESTSTHWRKFLNEHPAILALPCGIAKTTTIAGLLQHIVAVELRYAERISGTPETDYEKIPFDTVEAVYATHDRAITLYRKALEGSLDWNTEIEFATRSAGRLRASYKTIFFHAVFHGIRHYAQLGTLAREHGYTTNWFGDYLIMGARRPN